MNNSKELQDFENQIFDSEKNPSIKYNIDHSIEASIKYDFLVETYGKELVDSVVPDFHALYDHSYFLTAKKKLEECE